MKYVVCALLMTGIMFAAPHTSVVEEAIIDDGSSTSGPGYGIRQATMIDSCANQYTLTLQNQECISYDPTADGIVIVNRGYENSGDLNVHTAPGDLSFWLHDMTVHSQDDLGPGRYPQALAAGTAPIISYPYLFATWGGFAAQYCEGGWFSGFWGDEVDLGPGDLGTQTCFSKEMPNGNICFLGYSTAPYGLLYRTYDATMSTELASGWVSPISPHYYWGYDCNLTAGIAYVFYLDATDNLYYKTTTDGVTWSAEQTYNLIWPTPFTNSILDLNHGCQMAVTDAGDPLLVLQMKDNDDLSYPFYCNVYVSHTEGQPCAEVAFPDSECFYPTIATGGNMAAVTFNMPRDDVPDSLCWQDIYITRSTDNGQTWGTPQNLTGNSDRRTSMPQLAKRLDVARNRAYVVWPTCRLLEEDMDLFWAYGGPAPNIYVNFEAVPVGIEEHETETPSRLTMNITNPVSRSAKISYTLTNAGDISLKVYDRTGSLVRTIESGYKEAGVYNLNLNVSELANGTYFARLDTSTDDLTRTFVVIH